MWRQDCSSLRQVPNAGRVTGGVLGGPKPMDARRMSDATLLEELLATRKELSAANEELATMRERAVQAAGQKERMTTALEEAKEHITSLREEVDKLCAPPNTYGVYLSVNQDGTVNVLSQGRKVKVNL